MQTYAELRVRESRVVLVGKVLFYWIVRRCVFYPNVSRQAM